MKPWSPDNPDLYTLSVEVWDAAGGDQAKDSAHLLDNRSMSDVYKRQVLQIAVTISIHFHQIGLLFDLTKDVYKRQSLYPRELELTVAFSEPIT